MQHDVGNVFLLQHLLNMYVIYTPKINEKVGWAALDSAMSPEIF